LTNVRGEAQDWEGPFQKVTDSCKPCHGDFRATVSPIKKLPDDSTILYGVRLAILKMIQRMEEIGMLKATLIAAFIAVTALSPAYAAQDLCNDAHMKQMDEMIAKMTDATKKKEATTALDMSKAAMKKGDTAGCMKHMDEAHKAMGM
jgi:cytochrome c556